MVAAEGTFGRRGVLIADDLAAAALADVRAQSGGFIGRPLCARVGVPFQLVGTFVVQILVIRLEGFDLELSIAEGAFHFLYGAVKG